MKKATETSIFLALLLIPFYFFRFKILAIPTNIFEVMVFVSFCLTIFYNYKKISKIENRLIYFFAFLFILAGIIGLYQSTDRTAALGILKGWILVPIVFAWVIVKNYQSKKIREISIPFSISLLIVSVWTILQKYHYISTLFYQKGDTSFDLYLLNGRVFGPFESPNFLAMYLVPAFFISLPVLSYIKSRFLKNIFAVLFLLPVIALVCSASLGGLIAFSASMALFLLFYLSKTGGKNLNRLKIILPPVLILANAAFLFLAIKYPDIISKQDKIRSQIYDYSLSLLKGNSIVGIGLADFQSKIAEAAKQDLLFTWFGLPYALHPHNLFLAVWLSMGLLGIVALLCLVAEFLGGIFSIPGRIKYCLIAAMTAILIHGFFDTTYFKNDLSATFWLLMASAVVLGYKDEKSI